MKVKCGKCGGPMVAVGSIGEWDGDWECKNNCNVPKSPKEDPKDQNAFYKEFRKRVKANKGDYGTEDFAFDLFVENRKFDYLKSLLAFMSLVGKTNEEKI